MTFMEGLQCTECGQDFEHDQAITLCTRCAGHLEVLYDYPRLARSFDPEDLPRRGRSIWRWREFLPLADDEHIVTLGEGGTPLLSATRAAAKVGVGRLLLKYEAANPTASFKDRSFSVAVSKALENGVRTAFTRSSGNAGASFAAYASAGGLEALVMVNAWATDQKLAMIQAYGQPVVKVSYEDYSELRALLDRLGLELGLFEFTNFVNPFRHEGLKTYAYEICEQMGWDVPDWIVFPTGSGGGLAGCWKGLKELRELGLIQRMPKLACVQPERCAPLVAAFRQGRSTAEPHGELGVTIAQSIASNAPVGEGKRPLAAVRDSGGHAETVSDEEILQSIDELGKEGVFAEPASAAALAAVKKLRSSGVMGEDETVVCVVTASGLKQTDIVGRLHPPAPTVDLAGLESLLRERTARRSPST